MRDGLYTGMILVFQHSHEVVLPEGLVVLRVRHGRIVTDHAGTVRHGENAGGVTDTVQAELAHGYHYAQ
jgi:hypothetical protein